MKKTLLYSLTILLAITVKTGFSQTWVEKMQDPSVNFYDVQKSFNDYYKDSERKHRKEEARDQKELSEKLAKQEKSGVMPKKGQILLPGEKEEEELTGGWEIFKR